ncbi:hypothetical protein ACQ4PT_045855 [Festuca glaucescens]
MREKGVGAVKCEAIINDLTSQPKPTAQPKQNPSQNGEQSSSNKRATNMDILMERMKNELKDHIDTQIGLVPKRCAEEILQMLNKNGVMYKPAEGSQSDKGGDDEENESVHNDDSLKKESVYKKSSDKVDALFSNLTKNSDAALADDPCVDNKYVTPAKHNGLRETEGNVYITPEYLCKMEDSKENPWVINDNTKPASSSEVSSDIFASSTIKVNGGQKDDVQDGAFNQDRSFDSLQTMCANAIATGKKDNTANCANTNASERKEEEEGGLPRDLAGAGYEPYGGK